MKARGRKAAGITSKSKKDRREITEDLISSISLSRLKSAIKDALGSKIPPGTERRDKARDARKITTSWTRSVREGEKEEEEVVEDGDGVDFDRFHAG